MSLVLIIFREYAMMFQIVVLLAIVSVALILFIGGWVRVDVVGLLVLSALALTGLVTPQDALAGFSSPAVVTVWAMFILSAGLTRTGIAYHLGEPLQRFARSSEALVTAALMISASLLSALINTVTVAAILLPATMELSRRSGRPPSRLLMPLALGCVLGGPFTGISTPPNILVTDMLRSAGLRPFAIFEFTPIVAAIVAAGIAFIVLVGRHLLPKSVRSEQTESCIVVGASYKLDTYIFRTRIPDKSLLEGRTIAESRLGSALYLTVLALQRNGTLILSPRPTDMLHSGDLLIVHGRSDHLQRLHGSQHLQIESPRFIEEVAYRCLCAAEGRVTEESPLMGSTLKDSGLRREHRVNVLAMHSPDEKEIKDMVRHRLVAGQRLLMQGEREAIEEVARKGYISDLRFVNADEIKEETGGRYSVISVRIPHGSVLVGNNLVQSRLGNVFGLTVVSILRNEELICMPSPNEEVLAGDLLLLQGSPRDLEVLESLQELEIEPQTHNLMSELESQEICAAEILLSPRTTIAGRTLSELLFREHYGISVLAIWRRGRAHRTGIQDIPLEFGDALLVYGHRSKLEVLARDPNFLVLDKAAAQAPRLEKGPISVAIMLAVLLSAIFGIVPIAIAAVTGAALMVLAGCLSMEEAYRAIEWKVIFLIAGMLPLGVAAQNTGAAEIAAKALIASVGDLGPRWVVAAFFIVTVIATQIIPTAALVVLMAPLALSTASTLGISPHLLMMTVAISASASFASPLSHPAHLLVMGPGGYRFTDYMKIGIPLTIIAFLVSVWLLPIFWLPQLRINGG
jgi:di/tricarboxylate transporter